MRSIYLTDSERLKFSCKITRVFNFFAFRSWIRKKRNRIQQSQLVNAEKVMFSPQNHSFSIFEFFPRNKKLRLNLHKHISSREFLYIYIRYSPFMLKTSIYDCVADSFSWNTVFCFKERVTHWFSDREKQIFYIEYTYKLSTKFRPRVLKAKRFESRV